MQRLGVAVAIAAVGQHVVDGVELGPGERDVGGTGVLDGALEAAGPGDGNDVVALGQQPGKRQLADSDVLAGRELLEALDGFGVAFEVPGLPALVAVTAHVVLGVLTGGFEVGGEHAATEGAVGDEADTEPAGCWKDLVLDLAL